MRTIKFRGRHLCGQWYYGNLIIRETDSPVPETPQAYKCVMIGDVEDGSAEEVEEETIGQFTGLYDKNGKAIFEGDIIQGEYNHKHLIRYIEEDARFGATLVEFVGRKEEVERTCGVPQKWINVFGKVVIGNVHDNPELLRGEPKQ